MALSHSGAVIAIDEVIAGTAVRAQQCKTRRTLVYRLVMLFQSWLVGPLEGIASCSDAHGMHACWFVRLLAACLSSVCMLVCLPVCPYAVSVFVIMYVCVQVCVYDCALARMSVSHVHCVHVDVM